MNRTGRYASLVQRFFEYYKIRLHSRAGTIESLLAWQKSDVPIMINWMSFVFSEAVVRVRAGKLQRIGGTT